MVGHLCTVSPLVALEQGHPGCLPVLGTAELCPRAPFSCTCHARLLYTGAASLQASIKPLEMFLGFCLAPIYPPAVFLLTVAVWWQLERALLKKSISCLLFPVLPKLGGEMKAEFSSLFCSALGDPGPQGQWLTPSLFCSPSQAALG